MLFQAKMIMSKSPLARVFPRPDVSVSVALMPIWCTAEITNCSSSWRRALPWVEVIRIATGWPPLVRLPAGSKV